MTLVRNCEPTASANMTQHDASLPMGEEPVQHIEKGLTTFQDEEKEISAQPINNVPKFFQINPYPSQTPTRILERWYYTLPVTFTHSTSSTAETVVNGMSYLLDNVSFRAALYSFQLLRWRHIEYRIQYSSVPFQYGVLACSCLPRKAQGLSSSPYFPNAIASHTDTVLLDLSCQQDVVIRSPWLFNFHWYDWAEEFADDTSFFDRYNTLTIGNFGSPVKYLSSETPTSITLQISVRLVGVECAAHVQAFLTEEKIKKIRARYVTQSTTSELLDAVLPGSSQVLKLFENGGIGVSEVVKVGEQVAPELISTVKEAVGAARSAFADEKDGDNPDLRQNPYGSMIASASRMLTATGTVKSRFPTLEDPSGGGLRSDYTVMDILNIPSCLGQYLLPVDSTPLPLFFYPGQDWSRIGYFSQMFRYWRGSRKYSLVFFSSPFITARVTVSILWDANVVPGVPGDCLLNDVTIRGTTCVDIVLPYMNPQSWLPTFCHVSSAISSYSVYLPRIVVQTLEISAQGDVTPIVPILVYEKAGPDFQFRSLINPGPLGTNFIPPTEGRDKYVTQMRAISLCAGNDTTANSSPAYSVDSEVSISSMVRRWSPLSTLPIGSSEDMWPVVAFISPVNNPSVFDVVATMFLGFAGQMRFKGNVSPTTTGMICAHTNPILQIDDVPRAFICERSEDGMVVVDAQLTRVLECTIPFLVSQDWVYCNNELSAPRINTFNYPVFFHKTDGTAVEFDACYKAAGDDFSLFYPIPPPPREAWPNQLPFSPLQRNLSGLPPNESSPGKPVSVDTSDFGSTDQSSSMSSVTD